MSNKNNKREGKE
ncbi:hypothetical protein G210_1855 [Candida maltosa Xu316]|uniref:Uncharacterized protein n=1 Tax=Candida maltosa (strain Xu316) TaxID=1245528 RepID=M3K738_CANMX|nr:hypothetical protein G210_1855 [Candida maltosa Xu316]